MDRERASHVGGVLEEATIALEKAEAIQAEEARVRLMESTRDELVVLASEVGDRAEDKEHDLLIELGEGIEYK